MSDTERIDCVLALLPVWVDVLDSLVAELGVLDFEPYRWDQVDEWVDVVVAREEYKHPEELADHMPDKSKVTGRVEDHELEQWAFETHTAAEQGIEAHAQEREAKDDEARNVEGEPDN